MLVCCFHRDDARRGMTSDRTSGLSWNGFWPTFQPKIQAKATAILASAFAESKMHLALALELKMNLFVHDLAAMQGHKTRTVVKPAM